MRVLEAKDFLVQQTEQQARIERISLSDLEKRMMYYAEGKDASKRDSELNDEFDAQYNTADYEIKIGRLLQHAYVRLKETEPETARRWDNSIAFLGTGHHYISILWDSKYPAERPPHDFLKLLGSAIVVFCVIMTIAAFSDRMSRLFPHFPLPG